MIPGFLIDLLHKFPRYLAWRDGSAVKRTLVQCPLPMSGGSQLPVTTALGDQVPSSGFHRRNFFITNRINFSVPH
ncbi:hypothetical protein ACRRTK_017926 [Alexandromys fortis]